MMMNSMMRESQENKHVAVIVFPFASHPATLFNLVLKLAHASPNLLFSFIGTQHSNEPFLSKPNNPNNIKFYTISDGVPEGHVLGGNPVERVELFLQACPQNLHKGLDLAMEGTKKRVTCIIADAFVASSLIVARNLSVPWIAVWSALSLSLSAHFHTDLIRHKCSNKSDPHRPLDFIPGLALMHVEDLPEEVINDGEDETLVSKTLGSFGRVLPQAEAVVLSFFEELEQRLFVEDMRSKLKSLLHVGFFSVSLPLPPLPPSESDETGCMSWLDKQGDRSVVYVSFGTIVTLPPHEIAAVAEALEESGFPFLWSLKDHLRGVLPKGFLERTSSNGKVVPWAPQIQVLGHGSVGVHVTHSGSNAVFESICNGVPTIVRPFFADNRMTARMVEQVWEIGVRVRGGVFTKNGLIESLNQVLLHEEGDKMRENVQKLKRITLYAAGPQGRAAQDFKTLIQLAST